RIELFIKSPLENGLTRGEQMELARIALVSLDAEPVSQPYKLPEEKGASLQLRNLIRKRHAEWSDSTFGNVGPVGPLKHLSKEALEAAAEPGDLSEWADMQFLLWDAQRRAGISDGEITAAMEEKLKVNMARQWPEPKDGEPRLHIKEQPAPVVPAEMPKGLAGQIVSLLAHNIGDKFLAQKIWYACRAAMLQRVENAESRCGNPKVSPDGWIPVSERMPEESGRYWCYVEEQNSLGKSHYQWNCSWNGQAWSDKALSGRVTHWMPLPEPPQEEK
ncbi:DUF550 domain-containing protein, partial [Salmonella enterica]|nr:DUF550 domain-containing protein [Salmonella enterica]